jgi:S1-C subfamily serine protease
MSGMWRLGAAAVLAASASWGQAPGVPIEIGPTAQSRDVQRACAALRAAGSPLTREAALAQLDAPKPATLSLPEPQHTPLTPHDIYARARAGLMRVGWYFRQPTGEAWWLNFADGYALTADGAVVTCHHVLRADKLTMRDGFLVAATADGRVLPVTAVLAADRGLDTVILRVSGATLTPLPLNDQSAPGDPVWLLSDPLVVAGLFTEGIINRFFWQPGGTRDAQTLEGVRRLRMDVGTDWAPGSSGAAVLDVCGNCVGHVSAVVTQSDGPPSAKNNAPPLILHEAIAARGVMLLARAAHASGGG